jgi:GntR family transcriptional regulator/MocR family aminotransferase
VTQIEALAQRAAAVGVAIETLSSFAVGEHALTGVVLGYGGIATTDIEEGLRRLRKCFGQLKPGGATTPL